MPAWSDQRRAGRKSVPDRVRDARTTTINAILGFLPSPLSSHSGRDNDTDKDHVSLTPYLLMLFPETNPITIPMIPNPNSRFVWGYQVFVHHRDFVIATLTGALDMRHRRGSVILTAACPAVWNRFALGCESVRNDVRNDCFDPRWCQNGAGNRCCASAFGIDDLVDFLCDMSGYRILKAIRRRFGGYEHYLGFWYAEFGCEAVVNAPYSPLFGQRTTFNAQELAVRVLWDLNQIFLYTMKSFLNWVHIRTVLWGSRLHTCRSEWRTSTIASKTEHILWLHITQHFPRQTGITRQRSPFRVCLGFTDSRIRSRVGNMKIEYRLLLSYVL